MNLTNPTPRRSVAVVGGGPGGLSLARILAMHDIACTVFESDAHRGARPQGGSLDIHADSGQLALVEGGLLAPFLAIARAGDEYDAIYAPDGALLHEHAVISSGLRPEIDRAQLRDLLLDALPEGVVRWGARVGSVASTNDGGAIVRGIDGETLGRFDLVVGADGAWSKVRPAVSEAVAAYTGVTFVELSIDAVDDRHPAIAKLLPRGKLNTVKDGVAFIAQRSSGGHVRAYFMLRVADGRTGVDTSSLASAKRTLAALLEGWAPMWVQFVDASDAVALRPIVALPIGHRWPHRKGITLLGDAAHVMPPFGEGVNMAMQDAAELGVALVTQTDWDAAVAAYEAAMFVRAAEAAAGSAEGLNGMVSVDGLAHILAFFRAIDGASDGASDGGSDGAGDDARHERHA
jgi:2-polyprenyl-6-methoxyphenol hydroxylase-like FAD-dependent oxidoreductase